MGFTKSISDRMSTISTTSSVSGAASSSTHHSHSPSHDASINTSRSSLQSASSLDTLSSSTPVPSIGESIPPDQRPRIISPALKTPSYPSGNGITMVYSTTIHAPLQTVACLLLDARTYPQWNAFCPSITITSQPKSTAPLPACLASDPVLASIANNHTTLRDGTAFNFNPSMDGTGQPRRRRSPTMQVSLLEQFERPDGRVGVRMAWKMKGLAVKLLLRSERVQELVPAVADDGKPCVEYVSWDTYYGMLTSGGSSYYSKQIEAGCTAWMGGLKAHAEERAQVGTW